MGTRPSRWPPRCAPCFRGAPRCFVRSSRCLRSLILRQVFEWFPPRGPAGGGSSARVDTCAREEAPELPGARRAAAAGQSGPPVGAASRGRGRLVAPRPAGTASTCPVGSPSPAGRAVSGWGPHLHPRTASRGFIGRLDVFFRDVAIQTLCSHLINLPFHYRTARIPHVILTCSRYKSSSGMLFANTFSRSLRCLPIFSRASSEAQKLLIPISPTCSLFLCGLCFWRHIEEAVP